MSEKSLTEQIKGIEGILSNKFEEIKNCALDNYKRSFGEYFYDFDVMTEELLGV